MVVAIDGTSALDYCNIVTDTSSSKEVSNDEFNKLLCDANSKSSNIDINTDDYSIDIDFWDIEREFLFVDTDKTAISSFEDYKSARISYNINLNKYNKKDRDINEINFEKEFEKFLEYKNCDSADELSNKVSVLNELTSKEVRVDEYTSYNKDLNGYRTTKYCDKNLLLKGQTAELTKEELQKGYNCLLIQNKDYNKTSTLLLLHGLDAQINSLEDYIKNYDIINPPSFDEYCNEQLNGIKRDINFEAEFKNYLTSRDCKTEADLQALNTKVYRNAETLKFIADMEIRFYLGFNVDYGSLEYILNNLSIEDRVNFYNNLKTSSTDSTDYIKGVVKNAFKKLLEKFRNDPNINIDFDKVFSGIDTIIETMRNPDKANNEIKINEKIVNKKKAFFGYSKV